MRMLVSSMLAVALLSTAQAEIRLVYPRPQLARSDMTEPPCGDGFDRAFQEEYTEITPGPLTIRWEETVPRPGSPMRLSVIDIDNIASKCILLDHIPHNSNSQPTPSENCQVREYPVGECTNSMNYITVDIPDVRCDRCVMQLMSVVTNDYGEPCVEDENGIVNCTTFYSCSNIKIIPTVTGITENTTSCMAYPGANAKKWPYLQHVLFEANLDMPEEDPQPFDKYNFVRLFIKNGEVSFDINLKTPRLNIVNDSVVIVNPDNGIVLRLGGAKEVSPMRFKSYKTSISEQDKQYMQNGQLYIRMTDDQGNALQFAISNRMEKFLPGIYRPHELPYSKNGWLSGKYFVGDYATYPAAIYPAGPSQPADTHQYVSVLRTPDQMVKGVVAFSLSGEIVSIKAFVDGNIEAMYLGTEASPSSYPVDRASVYLGNQASSTSYQIGKGSIYKGRVMGTEHIGNYMKSISGSHPSQVISTISMMNVSQTITSPVQRGMKAIMKSRSDIVGLAVVTFDDTNSFMITLVLDNMDGRFSQNTNITLNGPVTSSGSAPVLVHLSGDDAMFYVDEKSLILEKRIHLEKTFFPLYLWSGYLYIDVINDGISADGVVSGQIHRLTNSICDGIDSIACSSQIELSDTNSSVANEAVVPVQAEALAYLTDGNETLSWGIILRGLKRSETVEYIALMDGDVVLVEYRDPKMLSEMFRPATGEDQVLIGQGKIDLSMEAKRVLQDGFSYFAIGTNAFVENQNIKTSLRGQMPAFNFVNLETDVTSPETVTTREPQQPTRIPRTSSSTAQPIQTDAPSTAQPIVTDAPSTVQPVVTDAPSTAQPIETEAPSTAAPIVTEAPSTPQPIETDAPSTAQPIVTDAPSTVQPVVTDAPSTAQPIETEAPSTAAPIVTEAPSTVQPIETDVPSTAQPVVTDAPSTVQPIETDAPSTAQPIQTDAPSTAQPVVTDAPSTPQPVVTDAPSTAEPIVTDTPSTAQPVVTDAPSTAQPIATEALSTAQPIETDAPSTLQPIVTEGPSTAQPIETDAPSTAQPIQTDAPSTVQPVETDAPSTPQPVVTGAPSSPQPMETDAPSTAQPVETDAPSTPQPVVTEAPSTPQPIVTEGPSTAQPVLTDAPSTAQPLETDAPSATEPIETDVTTTAQLVVTDASSTAQPIETDEPAIAQPTETGAPSTAQPVVTDAPSTAQPSITDAPSTVQPVVTEDPSTTQPIETDAPSTAQPIQTDAPSTAQPIETDVTSTAQPIVTDAESTFQPIETDAPSTAQPIVTDAPSTAQPTVTDAPSTAQPIVTDAPSTTQPIVTDAPSTAQPIVTDAPSTVQPIVTDSPTTAQPVVTEEPTTVRPVVTEAPTTARPVVTDAPTTVRPVVTDAPTTAQPVVTDAPTTAQPVVTEVPTTARPVVTEAQTTARPVVTEAPTTAPPVVTEAPTTARPVVTDTPTRIPTATPRAASPSTTRRRLPPTTTTRRQFVTTASPLRTTIKSITTSSRRTGSETDFKCIQAGMFADPFDCHAFHMCVGMNYRSYFIDYKMACPVSLVFDENTDRCQWPRMAQHVKCNYDRGNTLS